MKTALVPNPVDSKQAVKLRILDAIGFGGRPIAEAQNGVRLAQPAPELLPVRYATQTSQVGARAAQRVGKDRPESLAIGPLRQGRAELSGIRTCQSITRNSR